jgi:hypothetical protein
MFFALQRRQNQYNRYNNPTRRVSEFSFTMPVIKKFFFTTYLSFFISTEATTDKHESSFREYCGETSLSEFVQKER